MKRWDRRKEKKKEIGKVIGRKSFHVVQQFPHTPFSTKETTRGSCPYHHHLYQHHQQQHHYHLILFPAPHFGLAPCPLTSPIPLPQHMADQLNSQDLRHQPPGHSNGLLSNLCPHTGSDTLFPLEHPTSHRQSHRSSW